jgi:hypothetical protein
MTLADGDYAKREQAYIELRLMLDSGCCSLREWIRLMGSNLTHKLSRIRAGRAKRMRRENLSRYSTEFRELHAIPRVRTIETASPMLIINTDMLFGLDDREWKRTWHKIGRFRIEFNLMNGHVKHIRWHNVSGIRVNDNYSPTGISQDGSRFCIGDAKSLIESAYAQRRMVDLASYLVRFAECPGATYHIEHWPIASRGEVPKWYLKTFEER